MDRELTPPPARAMLLSLVVRYEDARIDDAMEAAKALLEKARERGEVTVARLDVDLT